MLKFDKNCCRHEAEVFKALGHRHGSGSSNSLQTGRSIASANLSKQSESGSPP